VAGDCDKTIVAVYCNLLQRVVDISHVCIYLYRHICVYIANIVHVCIRCVAVCCIVFQRVAVCYSVL